MDRHEAYNLLATVLARFESLPFEELAARVGESTSERLRCESGNEFLVDVEVNWAGEYRERGVCITASADSPSTFRMERLEERIVITEGTT